MGKLDDVSLTNKLIAVIQMHGSDAVELRDAAHEACHALAWKVKGKWTRDGIHRRKPIRIGHGISDEITARAVEQIVCADLGAECWTVEQAAFTCWLEMLKNEGISLPSDGWLADRIRERMQTPEARELADRVIALAETSSRRKQKA